MNDTIHPFEKVGLGKAPFRFVGFEHKIGPLVIKEEGGVTFTVGSPGQPMGSCAYCGQGIAECCWIRSADGKEFVVGNVCVGKTGDSVLVRQTESAVKKHRREAKLQREKERILNARQSLPSVADELSALPHPFGFEGKTRLSYIEFLLSNGGHSGQFKAARLIEDALESKKESS